MRSPANGGRYGIHRERKRGRQTMRIGIDLGGTKIEAIALDGDGNVILRERIATPRGDYGATLSAIDGLVESIETRLGRTGPAQFLQRQDA